MARIFKVGVLCLLLLSFPSGRVFSLSASRLVKQGNRFYKQKRFDEALKKYHQAMTEKPDSCIVSFNAGAALYKKGDYERAIESFKQSLLTEDSLLEARANYNIGNCKYKQGRLRESTDIAQAVEFYREALDYYKRAIELNEKDKEAKFNHEFVEKRLKSLLDKLAKGTKGKGEQTQKKEEKEQREKEKEKKEEKNLGKTGEEKGTQPAVGKEETKEMSEQEARLLLEGYRQEEEMKGKVQLERELGEYPEVLRDW